METPTFEEVECLVGWPKGTTGEFNDKIMLMTYMDLCKENGFGRMSQIAQQVDDIWRNPKKVAHYKKAQKKRFKLCGWESKE
jgi:hypothetical protein